MSVAVYSRRDLTLIGSLLTKRQPHIAAELLSSVPNIPALDNNIEKIPAYFTSFLCYSKSKKLFIAVMLAIYDPTIFLPVKELNLKRGLIKALVLETGDSRQFVHRLIKEVVMHYKIYDDFREQVEALTDKLTGGANG